MGMTKKTCLSFLTIVLFPVLVFSQKIEVGAGIGPTYYKGDLQPTFRVFNPSVGTNIFARYNFIKAISFKANGFIGRVTGNDKKSGDILLKTRGYRFFNDLWDYNGQIEYNFLNFRTHNGRYRKKYTPYLFAGFGSYDVIRGTYFSPHGSNSPSNLRNVNVNYFLPFGIGYKTILNGKWNFGVEFSSKVLLHLTKDDNTDSFDSLADLVIGSDPSFYVIPGGTPGTLTHANTPQNDKYFYISFSVSYLFYKVHCPPGR